MRLAAVKPTSNGEPLRGDPVPSCSDELQTGVETCIQAHRMVPGPMCGVHVGEAPAELNGGATTELTDNSMVVAWDSPNLSGNRRTKSSVLSIWRRASRPIALFDGFDSVEQRHAVPRGDQLFTCCQRQWGRTGSMSKVPYKPTSNGEALSGNPVPRCSDELQNGVETCVTPQRMAPADKHGVHAGEVPAELNGGRVDGGPARDRARGRDGIVRTFGKPENQQLASGKSDLDSPATEYQMRSQHCAPRYRPQCGDPRHHPGSA